MQIRTDDDVYRVDAVWLGPPRATFPWRARYSSYGVGLIVMIAVMFFQRRIGIPIGFFSVAWALLITVVVVRFVSKRIDEDRPLLEWLTLFFHELRGPRRRTRGEGSTVGTGHVQVEAARPRRALPSGRTDPHAALAVSDRAGRPAARRGPAAPGTRRRPDDAAPARPARRASRRSWTARGGRVAPPPSAPPETMTTESVANGRATTGSPTTAGDDDVTLHVPARRADRPTTSRPRPPRSRPSAGPRRFGPSARGAAENGVPDRAAPRGAGPADAGPDDSRIHSRKDDSRPDDSRPDSRHDEEGDGAAPARS